jgi:hypothetical protein
VSMPIDLLYATIHSAMLAAAADQQSSPGRWMSDPAMLVFVPLLALSVYTVGLALHTCRALSKLRRRHRQMRAADGLGTAAEDKWAADVRLAASAEATPEARRAAAEAAIDECLAPYDALSTRLGLCRDLSLPLAMLACAVKMIAALGSIGTASIARSSELIGASLWGTAFGVSLHVIVSLADGRLRMSTDSLEAALARVAADASRRRKDAATLPDQDPNEMDLHPPPPGSAAGAPARVMRPVPMPRQRRIYIDVWQQRPRPRPRDEGIPSCSIEPGATAATPVTATTGGSVGPTS